MIWRHWRCSDVSPFLVDDDVPVPNSWGIDFQGYLILRFLQELVAEALSQDTERLEIDITLGAGAFFGWLCFSLWVACAVDGHWWSLIGVDGLRPLSNFFLWDSMVEWSMSQPVLWHIWSKDWPLLPQQYLWVALVLDSFFMFDMFWQYRFLIGWPKTNCVPFIKRIPKRTLNLAVFVLDVPVLLCLCVCVRACFKFFQQPWDETRKYTNQNNWHGSPQLTLWWLCRVGDVQVSH